MASCASRKRLIWLIAVPILCLCVIGAKRPARRTAGNNTNDWITINKDYSSQRYVNLDQITPANVGQLKEVCEIQLNEPVWFNSGLLKVGRTLYVATLNATYAIDATTCQLRWRDVIGLNKSANFASRGVGYWDGMVFRGTVDGRVMALDAQTGKVVWDVQAASPFQDESFIAAPIAWDGKVFIGIATSDVGVRGHIMAFDAKTGKELWRFYTIPIGIEPGADTWKNAAILTPAGGGFWSSYSLDPAMNEVFAPVANPYPDYSHFAHLRAGDNLYTDSVVALNAATGKLNWYHQATANDDHDWDLGAPPTLYRTKNGKEMLAIAGKDGYVLGIDRTTKQVVFKTAGTTIANAGRVDDTLKLVCPGSIGGAQWNGTAYDPAFGMLYTGMVDWCFYYSTKTYTDDPKGWSAEEGDVLFPGGLRAPKSGTVRADFSKPPRGWITAMDGETGRVLWKYHADAQVIAGLVPTKSGLLFAGDTRGNLLALDAKTGAVLKRINAGGALNNGLISYAVDGTQYVAAAVGGLTLNISGVAGATRVVVYGLNGGNSPNIVKLDRPSQPMTGSKLFTQVCGGCHGMNGEGGAFPSLARQTTLTTPEALKTFLKTVPPPMPILYPGLLNDHDVELIAEHMKVITGQQNGTKFPALSSANQSPSAQGSPAWQAVYSVLTSPRCINCHTISNYPRQGNDRHPHIYGVVRGPDNKGAPVARCAMCHGDKNNAATGIPGAPNWQLAPLSMAWESSPGVPMTSAQLCSMLTDRMRNGDRGLPQLVEHVETEHLVLWSWHPGTRWNGEERITPPLSHADFVNEFKQWVSAGASCPVQ